MAFPGEGGGEDDAESLKWENIIVDAQLRHALEMYKQQQQQHLYSLLTQDPFFISELLSLHSQQQTFRRLRDTLQPLSLFDQSSLILGSRDELPSSFNFQVEIFDFADAGEEEIKNVITTTKLKTVTQGSNGNDKELNLAINAECVGLENLEFLSTILDSDVKSIQQSIIGLNLSSNGLGDTVWQQYQSSSAASEGNNNNNDHADGKQKNPLRSLSRLGYLLIGGNSNLYNVAALTSCLPMSLRVLDLSYSEGLTLSRMYFAYLPHLLRLSLDGCGLSDTCLPAPQSANGTSSEDANSGSERSFFDGLVNLRELSLKENTFETLESLYGLLWFGRNVASASSKTQSQSQSQSQTPLQPRQSIRKPTLERLWLGENEVTRESESRRRICELLGGRIETLQSIDSDILKEENADGGMLAGSVGKTTVYDVLAMNAVRGVGREDHVIDDINARAGGLTGGGLDNMEKEYLAALKGERDLAVVA